MRIMTLSVSSALLIVMLIGQALGAADVTPVKRPRISERMIGQLVEALTDERERFHRRAISALVKVGARCIPDLRIIAADENPALRLRVALIAGQIADDAASVLLVELGSDPAPEVREVVAIALGHHKTEVSLQMLAQLIQDVEPGVRESAALGLGFFGSPRAIRLLAHSYVLQTAPKSALPADERRILRAKSAAKGALFALCRAPAHLDDLAALMHGEHAMNGEALHILILSSFEIGDPRLCMPLIGILNRNVDAESHRLAVISLRANGDSRCLETLCRIAAGGLGPQQDSAATLAQLTGHRAAPGPAWNIWWRNHKQAIALLHDRDAFIAQLHDPRYKVNAQALAVYTVSDLAQILSGVLGAGADHWPKLAWRALRADDPKRWTQYLLESYDHEVNEIKRIGIILILAELADPAAIEPMRAQYADLLRNLKTAAAGQKRGSSERVALALFLPKK